MVPPRQRLWHMLPYPSMYLLFRHRWAVLSRVEGPRLLVRLEPVSSSTVLATDSPRLLASSSS